MSIRRRPRAFSLDELVQGGMLSANAAAFLDACVEAKRTVVVSGPARSGKTTLLSALLGLVPEAERLVLVEEAAELTPPHVDVVSLEAREGAQASVAALVRAASRLQPDRLVVGECRGPEAFELVSAISSGCAGSLTSIHASSPEEALARLETMACTSFGLSAQAMRAWVDDTVHIVAQLARAADGTRRVTHLSEVSVEGDLVTVQGIFVAPSADGSLEATGTVPRFLEHLQAMGVEIDTSIFK